MYRSNEWLTAWVTWPDGYRELVVETIDGFARLHANGCDIEVCEPQYGQVA